MTQSGDGGGGLFWGRGYSPRSNSPTVSLLSEKETTMNLEDLKAKFAGRTVKYTGMFNNADGPVGKVWRVSRHGIWVTLPDGSRQQWHAEDITGVR
jgi:hypothetical protein